MFTLTTSLVMFYLVMVVEDHIIHIVRSPMLRMTLLLPEKCYEFILGYSALKANFL